MNTATRLLAVVFVLVGAGPAQTITVGFAPVFGPPGAITQVAVRLNQAVPLTAGRVDVALDPVVFGDVTGVELHSATGDQYGFAELDGRRVSIVFQSPSGGMGRLPELPLATVRAPVLTSVALGRVSAALRIESVALTGLNAVPVPARAVEASEFVVGGTLSVEDVIPSAGTVKVGDRILVKGTGFDPGTTAIIAAVATSEARVISREWIEFNVLAPADLSGRRLSVRRPDGETLEHYISWRGARKGQFPTVLPLFPNLAMMIATGNLGRGPSNNPALALRNIGTARAEVSVESIDVFSGRGDALTANTFAVEPGETIICDECENNRMREHRIRSTAPLQMLVLSNIGFGTAQVSTVTPSKVNSRALLITGTTTTVSWTAGAAPPAPMIFDVRAPGATSVPFSLEALSGEESRGVFAVSADSLVAGGNTGPPARLTVRMNTAGRRPGEYVVGIRVQAREGGPTQSVTVALRVLPQGTIALADSMVLKEVAPPSIARLSYNATDMSDVVTDAQFQTPAPRMVLNAASQASNGRIAPGELVTIHGDQLGPESRVLFDDAPARVIYQSATQINVVVPENVDNERLPFTILRVEAAHRQSTAWGVPLTNVEPGVFTATATGQGMALALRADGRLVDANNPVPVGHAFFLFATGLRLATAVRVHLGEAVAQVQTIERDAESGVWRIRAVVPADVALLDSDRRTVSIREGDAQSPNGVWLPVTRD